MHLTADRERASTLLTYCHLTNPSVLFYRQYSIVPQENPGSVFTRPTAFLWRHASTAHI